MLRYLALPVTAVLILAMAVVSQPAEASAICNQKVCVGGRCTIADSGPNTFCVDIEPNPEFFPDGFCSWDFCNVQ